MNADLTERQKNILKDIIEEYIFTAHEVSSHELLEKYDYKISSATIRNEMMELTEKGYLVKSHFSSGRIPTDLAFRLYVMKMMREGVPNAIDEVKIKNDIFKSRFDEPAMINEILSLLSENIIGASFLIKGDQIRYYGVSRLMKYQELRDIMIFERLMDLLEDRLLLRNILSKYNSEEVGLIIGKEIGVEDLEDCSLAYTAVNLFDDENSYVGVIGSRRVDYAKMLKTMQSIREAIEESLRGWI